MDGVSGLCHDSIESTVMVGGVLDGARGAVGLHQAVVTFNLVTYTLLSLLLDIMCLCVLNSIPELVLWWGLKRETKLLLELPAADISGLW